MKDTANFKQTQLGQIPEDWEIKKISDLANVNPESISSDESYQFINYLDISSVGTRTIEEYKKISFEEAPSRAKRKVREGDTLIATVRPNRKSYTKLKKLPKNPIASTGFAVLRAKKPAEQEFLHYFATSERATEYYTSNARGSAYPAVNISEIKDYAAPVPSKTEERRNIGKFFRVLDQKIELNRRMNKTLEEIGKAIFKHWFIDFEFPWNFEKNEFDLEGEPYKSGGGEMKKTDRINIPQHWELENLGDVISLEYGKGLRKKDREEGPYPVYGSSGIIDWHKDFLVTAPSIVVGRKGNVGSIFWVEEHFNPIDTVYYVKSELNIYYLYYKLKNTRFFSSDSAVPGLSKKAAYSVKWAQPSKVLQDSFGEICRSLFNLKKILKEQNSKLIKICDLLLPRLMSGRIRI